jgi:hypothetical protein
MGPATAHSSSAFERARWTTGAADAHFSPRIAPTSAPAPAAVLAPRALNNPPTAPPMAPPIAAYFALLNTRLMRSRILDMSSGE